MHSKLDVLGFIKQLCSFVTTQFSGVIKAIQTDNALDFFKTECTLHFASLGIMHKILCPYTPQQIGIIKRKHRHLLDIARALRFQSSTPLKLLGDCIVTSCYLLIVHQAPYWEISHHLSSYFRNHPLTHTFESLVVCVMLLFCIPKTSFLPGLIFVSSWVTLVLKRVIS